MTRIFGFFAVAMTVAAVQATPASAQSLQIGRCFGDRPYYDYDSSGWLDNEYHPGVDCRIAPQARH
jgi:hypothetical protein